VTVKVPEARIVAGFIGSLNVAVIS